MGARFIFFGFLAFVLGKRKKKAKSRKEKKNRGDKVLLTKKNFKLMPSTNERLNYNEK